MSTARYSSLLVLSVRTTLAAKASPLLGREDRTRHWGIASSSFVSFWWDDGVLYGGTLICSAIVHTWNGCTFRRLTFLPPITEARRSMGVLDYEGELGEQNT